MSKKIILYLMSCIFCILSYGQKEDYNWIIGSSTLNQIMFDDIGYVVDTFTPNPFIRIHVTNASISDSLGSLQLFSGGTAVYSAEGDIIPNGDSLNPGFVRENFSLTPGAYSSRNGGFFVPSLNDNGYRFFHLKEDTNRYIFPSLNYAVGVELFYSIIKNDDNQYMVDKKNISILKDTLNTFGITACRHGNGRDWWLIASEGGSNCYYTLLYTPDTIIQVHKQCLGVKSEYIDGGQSLFSLDGSLFVRGSTIDGVEIFDFDRCSGLLSNGRSIYTDSSLGFSPYVSISPNGRYIYHGYDTYFCQYDLNSNDIFNNRVVLYDAGPPPYTFLFASHQIGPDGKIYISGATYSNWHIIQNPNEHGISCNLELEIPLLAPGSFGLPTFPNYRLGALTGSACDTLGVGIKELSTPIEILLKPNPTSSFVEVDYGFFPWQSKSEAVLRIHNLLGEEVFSIFLPQYSAKQIIDIRSFAAGVYFVGVYDRGFRVGMERMIVE